MAWLVPAMVAGVIGMAVISYARSGETYAAAGSPYYGKAVQEAISGLKNPGGNALPAGRPPLPAGLSPAEHDWCENCKTYHKREAGQPAAVAPAPAPVAGGGAAAAHAAEAIPPLPEGQSASDHYWCVNCKTYHPRPPAQNAAAWAGVPYKLPVPPSQTLEK